MPVSNKVDMAIKRTATVPSESNTIITNALDTVDTQTIKQQQWRKKDEETFPDLLTMTANSSTSKAIRRMWEVEEARMYRYVEVYKDQADNVLQQLQEMNICLKEAEEARFRAEETVKERELMLITSKKEYEVLLGIKTREFEMRIQEEVDKELLLKERDFKERMNSAQELLEQTTSEYVAVIDGLKQENMESNLAKIQAGQSLLKTTDQLTRRLGERVQSFMTKHEATFMASCHNYTLHKNQLVDRVAQTHWWVNIVVAIVILAVAVIGCSMGAMRAAEHVRDTGDWMRQLEVCDEQWQGTSIQYNISRQEAMQLKRKLTEVQNNLSRCELHRDVGVRKVTMDLQTELYNLKKKYQSQFSIQQSNLTLCQSERGLWQTKGRYVQICFNVLKELKRETETELLQATVWDNNNVNRSSIIKRVLGYSQDMNEVLEHLSDYLHHQQRTISQQLIILSYAFEQWPVDKD